MYLVAAMAIVSSSSQCVARMSVIILRCSYKVASVQWRAIKAPHLLSFRRLCDLRLGPFQVPEIAPPLQMTPPRISNT
jgi:hypothetical protein